MSAVLSQQQQKNQNGPETHVSNGQVSKKKLRPKKKNTASLDNDYKKLKFLIDHIDPFASLSNSSTAEYRSTEIEKSVGAEAFQIMQEFDLLDCWPDPFSWSNRLLQKMNEVELKMQGH
jgi:hypothetical protein